MCFVCFSSNIQSDVQSVASMDVDRRHLGYISDGQTISSSYSDSLTKKPKPIPPRKPSFLYLNRTSSLQSVNENKARNHSSTDEYKSSSNTTGKNGLKSSLANNLKWNILSSSRSKNGEMKKDTKDRNGDVWWFISHLSGLTVNFHTHYFVQTRHEYIKPSILKKDSTCHKP